jgi:hypothetical protein
MDTIFIWIVAGAAIGLLGIFLVASEKELKRKRQELAELKNQLADGPVPVISNHSTDAFPQDNGASAELIARNEELLQQISSLSKKLEASESRLEQLETLRAHLNSKESEVTELRWDRERLQAELATAKTPSESNDPHPYEADEANRNSQKDAEIAALKEQLEVSRAKVRDLESARESLGDTESRQTAFEGLRSRLEANNLQLQNELAAEQEKNKALEASQMRFMAMELRYQELGETNFQLREENAQHQQKLINQNQLQVERLAGLRQRLDELRLKQAKVSEQDRLVQEEIVSMSELLDFALEHTHQPEPPNAIPHDRQSMFEFRENESTDRARADIVERTPFGPTALELHSIHNDSFDKTNSISAEPQHHHSANLTTAIAVGTPVASELSPQPGLKEKKRRFGIFTGAVGVLVVGGVLAASYLGKDSEPESSATQPASPMSKEQRAKFEAMRSPSRFSTAANMESQPKPAETQSKHGDSKDKPIRVAPAIPLAPPVGSRIVEKSEKATTTIASSGKASSTAWESYEIVQPTRVFSAPSERSQLVANVEPGTQVNVVDSRNGWLEIRSKHGRPPGFIQKTAAKRIGQNN